MCDKAITKFLTAITEHSPKRQMLGEGLLMEAGTAPDDAAILERAAFRATHAATLAVGRVLDDFPANSQLGLVALVHVTGGVYRDMRELFHVLTALAAVIEHGGSAEDITTGDPNCDCETCTATRNMVAKLRQEG